MKKILTVSLFAMMAVSAANADIASTKYVDDLTGSATFTAGSSIASSADLTAAVNTLAVKVDEVVGSGDGSVADQISGALKNADASAFSASVKGSLDKADSALQKTDITEGTADGTIAVEGTNVAVKGLGSAAYTASTDYDAAGSAAAVEAKLADYTKSSDLDAGFVTETEMTTFKNANSAAITAAKTVADAAAADIAGMDGTDTLVDGKYYKAYTQTDGKISMTSADFKTSINALDGQGKSTETSLVAPTAKAVSDFVANNVALISQENQEAAGRLDTLEVIVSKEGTGLRDQFTALKEAGLTAETLANANSALQKTDITEGTANGTIAVEGTNVAVKGLGSAAYTQSSAYATAAQGELAASAMQEANLKALDSYTKNNCGTEGVMCSLVSDGGKISWEVVNQGK